MSGVDSLLSFVTRLSTLGRRRRAEQLEMLKCDWCGNFALVELYDGTLMDVCVHEDKSGAGARFVEFELLDVEGDPDAVAWFESEAGQAALLESWDARSYRWN